MLFVTLSLVFIFAVLVLAEWLRRAKLLRGEKLRKLIHVIVGSFVAIWPFFMSFTTIQALSLAMLTVVMVSRAKNIFPAVHDVQRKTWGELFFPFSIAAAAFLTDSPWVFMAAILHMGLADGFAAIVGNIYSKKGYGYQVFGHVKTLAGTAVFVVISIAITAVTMLFGFGLDVSIIWPLVIALSVATAAVENIAPYGLDNLFVTLLVVLVLNTLV